jgi:uncharacterized membrane protein
LRQERARLEVSIRRGRTEEVGSRPVGRIARLHVDAMTGMPSSDRRDGRHGGDGPSVPVGHVGGPVRSHVVGPLRGVALFVGLVVAILAPVIQSDAKAADPGAAPTALPASTDTPAASPSPLATDARAGPVVRGVFYFSPTCPHCEAVINDALPGIFSRYGGAPTTSVDPALPPGEVAFYLLSNGTLQLLMVDVSVDAGARMLVADADRHGLDQVVPRLSIADRQLIGSVDIPEELPTIVEVGLAGEGLDWPAVPDLAAALAPFPQAGGELRPSTIGERTDQADRGAEDGGADVVQLPAASLSVWDRVTRDPLGNVLAIVVLALLLGSLVAVPVLALRGRLATPQGQRRWLVPLLGCVGIAISGYLGYVESNGLQAVCGPVGDCHTVQASEYAVLFGVIPTWALGLVGYALILAGSILAGLMHARTADVVTIAIAAIAYGGTLASTWLTFLEPFVIGATCLWCLLSALTMLAILWLTAAAGLTALRRQAAPRPRMVRGH